VGKWVPDFPICGPPDVSVGRVERRRSGSTGRKPGGSRRAGQPSPGLRAVWPTRGRGFPSDRWKLSTELRCPPSQIRVQPEDGKFAGGPRSGSARNGLPEPPVNVQYLRGEHVRYLWLGRRACWSGSAHAEMRIPLSSDSYWSMHSKIPSMS